MSAYTPRMLSERWECSERHIRNLIRDGKLRAFRLGEKLIRITAAEVARADSLLKSGLTIEAPPPPPPPPHAPIRYAPIPRVEQPPKPDKPLFKPFNTTVYFVRAHDFVKIGWTTCLSMRLDAMSTTMPFEPEVILEIEGGRALEQELHEKFAPYRHRREWFRYEGELKAWVEARIGSAP